MITIDPVGHCKVAMINENQVFRRQDAPKFYDVTTVCYVMSLEYILSSSYMFNGNILMSIEYSGSLGLLKNIY